MANSHQFIVRNFPKNHPLYKKIWANIITIFGHLRYTPRKNLLNKKDYKAAKKIIKKGDIVLVGDLKEASRFFIHGPLTHALICHKRNRFIASTAHGVGTTTLNKLFKNYDTLMVLRLKKKKPEKINKAIKFTVNQLGKPYNFEFKYKSNSFYCSELIYEGLKHAGINITLQEIEQNTKIYEKIFKYDLIMPLQFVSKEMDIVFKSHNLDFKGKKVIFKKS